MAVSPTKNLTSPVILWAIVALGLIAGYFYYTQALQDQAQPFAPLEVAPGDNLAKFKDLSFDFGPFDSLQFKALRIFGESPVKPGATGRADIFAPF